MILHGDIHHLFNCHTVMNINNNSLPTVILADVDRDLLSVTNKDVDEAVFVQE